MHLNIICLLIVDIIIQTQTNQAIFKLQSSIGSLFREYLDARGFTEIHSPKLQGAATESGASVFKVTYFKGMSSLIVVSSVSLTRLDASRERLPGAVSPACETDGHCRRL